MKYFICTEGDNVGVVCSADENMGDEWKEISETLYKDAVDGKEENMYLKYTRFPLAKFGFHLSIYPDYVKITGRSITPPHPHRHFNYNEFRALYYTNERFRYHLEFINPKLEQKISHYKIDSSTFVELLKQGLKNEDLH